VNKKDSCINADENYKTFKRKMDLTARSQESEGNHSYRLSCFPVTVLDNIGWTEKTGHERTPKSIEVIAKLCGNVFILYRSKDEMEIVCRPPEGIPKVEMDDDDKETLKVFRDWLTTKMVGGYTGVKISCSDNVIIKSIIKQYILPLRELEIIKDYHVSKKDNEIELTFPDISIDFESQIEKCLGYLIELLEYTSSILKRLNKNGKDITKKTVDMDDEVDFSNWCIWRNIHLSLLSKSYLVGIRDPYELAIVSAYAKTIERAADNCVGIARLANQLYKKTQHEVVKTHLKQIFSELSEFLKEVEKAYETASAHFIGKSKVDLKEFKEEYVIPNWDMVKKAFDSSKASQKYKGMEPDLIASVWRDLGQMMSKTQRIVTYPYNIVLWKETSAINLKKI
jgi:phosphate uptake regulator